MERMRGTLVVCAIVLALILMVLYSSGRSKDRILIKYPPVTRPSVVSTAQSSGNKVEEPPTDWKTKRFTDDVWMRRPVTELIVVHHSATVGGNVEAIRRFHMTDKDRLYKDIGYHYVITNGDGGTDGEVQVGRPEMLVGSHAPQEKRNFRSVGVCLVGEDAFTDKQKASLIEKLVELCKKYKLEPSKKTIVPHHEQCPGKGLLLDDIIEQVKVKMG
jgi:hypothetical protein